jgi:hypothetical protein
MTCGVMRRAPRRARHRRSASFDLSLSLSRKNGFFRLSLSKKWIFSSLSLEGEKKPSLFSLFTVSHSPTAEKKQLTRLSPTALRLEKKKRKKRKHKRRRTRKSKKKKRL